MLLRFPSDIQSCIFRELRLPDISHIRQTCSELNTAVSNDKQLWLHILERETKFRSLPLSKFAQRIDKATASDVVHWVRTGCILARNYSSGFNRTVVRTNLSLHVTWVKLVRGRWALIACSDFTTSRLVVWDVQEASSQLDRATFYLPGTVVDGLVNDSSSEVLIAFTLGKRTASILILELFTDECEVRVRRLSEIPGASHVRLLQRPYVGFAVHNGDDTCPSIMNWETGCVRKFTLPDSVHDLPTSKGWLSYFRHEPCVGLFLWRGHVFLAYQYKTVIFGCPLHFGLFDDSVLLNAVYTQAHYMSSTCVEMSILQDNGPAGANHRQPVLHLAARGARADIYLMSAHYDEPLKQFVFDENYLTLPWVDNYQSKTRILCVGPSSHSALLLAINDHFSWPSPCLYMTPITSLENSVEFEPVTSLLTKGMPLLYEITSMDFDDGCGLFIVGSISGEVCVRSFGATFSPSSLENGLPVLHAPSDLKERMPFDLPIMYELRDVAPRYAELVEAALQRWNNHLLVPQASAWSSDWSSFRNIDQWMTSFPRWGILDKAFNSINSISARVRMRLGTLGEIIPVLFDGSNHFRVIFRIGDRLYYCRSADKKYDDNPEFELSDYGDVLGLLPVTYSQLLGMDAATIGNLIEDQLTRHILSASETSLIDTATRRQILSFDDMRESAARQDGEHIVDKTVDEWSEEDMVAVRDFIQRDALKPW